jgi:hypothetical protein
VVSPYSLLLFGGRIFTESKKSLIKVSSRYGVTAAPKMYPYFGPL